MSRLGASLEPLLWQTYAHLYDGLLDLFAYRDMIDQVVTAADCSGATVLDVGAGTGNVSSALLDAGCARVVSVDSSANMVQRTRRKLAEHVRAGRLEIVHDDAVAAMAALPAGSVDRITAVNFLYVLEDRRAFFREARRLLAPGGFVVAAHTTIAGSAPIAREQFRRGGLRSCLRPRLIGIAAIDLVIDLMARGGRYDFAPVAVLAREAAHEGLARMISLGRCYGDEGGVNELLTISAASG
jgi:SAM-dependent methyltransferase